MLMMTLKIETEHNEDEGSFEEKQAIVVEKLKKILLDHDYNKDIISKFFQRLLLNTDDDDDMFLYQTEQDETVKMLYNEFQIFNNQYEKLAQDWRKTAMAAREIILVNTVDIEQATVMKQHLDILDQRVKKFENLIPKALKNIVKLYANHFSKN